jgi:hypothetical protein
MYDDPIIDEIHEIRRQLLEEHGGLKGFMNHLRAEQEKMKDRVVSPPPRKSVAKKRKVS